MLFYHDGNVLINIDSGLKISVEDSDLVFRSPQKMVHGINFPDANAAKARFNGIVEKLAVSHSLV